MSEALLLNPTEYYLVPAAPVLAGVVIVDVAPPIDFGQVIVIFA